MPLTVLPAAISLGTLASGQPAQAEAIVRHLLAGAIGPVRLESHCPCLVVSPSEIDLGPAGSATIRVTFDPSESPEFRGALAVPIVGQGPDGLVVLRATVQIEVDEPLPTARGGRQRRSTGREWTAATHCGMASRRERTRTDRNPR